MSRSFALATLVAAALSACVVVPVDPRTGQPYPLQPAPAAVAPLPPQPVTLAVRLYPLNDAAAKAGLLEALVVDQHGGRGQFSVNYLGDTLRGEATRVAGGRGIANGFGSRGVSTQCEYAITGPGIGTGTCQFSDGARYRMHFGG